MQFKRGKEVQGWGSLSIKNWLSEVGNILAVHTVIRLGALTYHNQPSTEGSWKHQPSLPFPESFLREVLQPHRNQKSMYEFWLPHTHLPTASSNVRLHKNICKVLMCKPRSPLTFSHSLALPRGSLLHALPRCPLTMDLHICNTYKQDFDSATDISVSEAQSG